MFEANTGSRTDRGVAPQKGKLSRRQIREMNSRHAKLVNFPYFIDQFYSPGNNLRTSRSSPVFGIPPTGGAYLGGKPIKTSNTALFSIHPGTSDTTFPFTIDFQPWQKIVMKMTGAPSSTVVCVNNNYRYTYSHHSIDITASLNIGENLIRFTMAPVNMTTHIELELRNNVTPLELARQIAESKKAKQTPEFDPKATLLCPLSGKAISYPGRGEKCTHYQAFDISKFVMKKMRSAGGTCPICNRTIGFDELVFDPEYINSVLTYKENVAETISTNNNIFDDVVLSQLEDNDLLFYDRVF